MYARLTDGVTAAVRAALSGDVRGIAVATSGTTGQPREVLIGREVLRSSAEATHRRLAGPGRWLLAVPTDRIAGIQVLVRSFLAGTTPVAMPPRPFTPETFTATARLLVESTDAGVPLYTSLVPTQVRRLLSSADGTRALESLTAVLVGGARLTISSVPTTVVETYGATETSGGCVYAGLPLDGVQVRVSDNGRIRIAGATLADGYADGDDDAFVHTDGVRWFVTSDCGALREGRLEVLGRADDVIVTGGHKVHPVSVEHALVALDGIDEAVVVGVPDPEWGERVVALVVAKDGANVPSAKDVRSTLADSLPRFAMPREVHAVGRLPVVDNGKIDRGAARRLAQSGPQE